MWDTPFEVSMLDLPNGVVIHCPDKSLVNMLFEIFKENGIGKKNWPNMNYTHWDSYKEDTAYFCKDGHLLYGPKIHAEQTSYSYVKYTKCTFFGIETPDFDTASDELLSLLGIGGE